MATSRGEPERWGRGARERQAGARLSLIQLHAAAVTPSPVDTLCASQTNGLSPCSAALFLSHRHAPPPLTWTHSLTHPHTLLTHPRSPTLTHTYSSHTLIHHLHTPHALHKHIHSSHPHTPSHTHTLTHSSPAHIYTQNHRRVKALIIWPDQSFSCTCRNLVFLLLHWQHYHPLFLPNWRICELSSITPSPSCLYIQQIIKSIGATLFLLCSSVFNSSKTQNIEMYTLKSQ